MSGILALGFVATYISASALFWNYPHLIHKKKRVAFFAKHISHRGGAAEGYENTILNFRRAVMTGTDMLELDVRLTKDNEVVVFHDKDLLRTAGLKKSVSELSYSQLPLLLPTIPIDFLPGQKYLDMSVPEKDRRIPLLSHVFKEFPAMPMNIDIKDNNSPELILAVKDLIHKYNRQHITVWGSFDSSVSELLYKSDPTIGLFFSGKRAATIIILALTGLLPFVPIKETHYEVFLPLSIRRRRLKEGGAQTRTEKMILWVCDRLLVWKGLITHLQRRGIQVYYWVANEEDEYEECLRIGADGIMTDYPRKLKSYLNTHQYRSSYL